MSKVICFYDFEATSVSRDSDPISLGIIAVQNNKVLKSIYCEFTDFNIDKCDDWVKENIVGKLQYKQNEQKSPWFIEDSRYNHYFGYGNQKQISIQLKQWLFQFEEIEFWADFDVIDKPMLIDLITDWETREQDVVFTVGDYQTIKTFVNKIGLPKHLPNIKYDRFFDLHSVLHHFDKSEINREKFVGITEDLVPFEMQTVRGLDSHNALWGAYVTWRCYDKLNNYE